jgi:transcriptional regulator with XRE-family HTH domain
MAVAKRTGRPVDGMHEQAMADFRHRLRLERQKRNLTQADAARLLGVTERTYARYERGETEPWKSMDAIVEHFGVKPPALPDAHTNTTQPAELGLVGIETKLNLVLGELAGLRGEVEALRQELRSRG